MVLFARQEDRTKDPKSHMHRREENQKWDGDKTRTDASQGLYKSIVGPSGLSLFMSAEVVDREDKLVSRKMTTTEEYVSVGNTLSRVMASSSSQQWSGASTKPSSGTRPRARSAVPHAATKLNDTLARAWMDRQDSEHRSRSAAAVRSLLIEAQHQDTVSTAAIEQAARTVIEITARSQRKSERSKVSTEDELAGKPHKSRKHMEREGRLKWSTRGNTDELNLSPSATQSVEPTKVRATSGSSLQKRKELSSTSQGLHSQRELRPPYLNPKMKRHDPESFYSNTMRPASAAPEVCAETPPTYSVLLSPSRGTLGHTGKLLSGNSVISLRYPSGAPETAPHRGEFREDVHCMGSHWNFRFQNKVKNKAGAELENSARPQSAFAALSPAKIPQGAAKDNTSTSQHKQAQQSQAEVEGFGMAIQTGGVTGRAKGKGGVKQELEGRAISGISLTTTCDVHQAAAQQDASVMSISVGNHGIEDLNVGYHGIGSTDSVGRMVWEGLDGECVSPRHFHRKRSDLTSRRQVRMGYGINQENMSDLSASPLPPPVHGVKTLQAKRMKQKKYAEEIAAATQLQRPRTPVDLPPNHSALPMNRPTESNWAFQTIYLPKTVAHWNPGNVSKIIRKIDYPKERPTFGAHFNSN